MSKSTERIDRVTNKLKDAFVKTPYYLKTTSEGDSIPKDDILLSVIIPARNEFPNIVWTMHSIINTWEADGFDIKDLEIIIVNNTSDPWNDPKWDWTKPGDKGTVEYLMPRGAYWSRVLRIHYDPIAGNHSARNSGAKIARGKYLMFSDGHMAYKLGTFKYGLETTEKTGGLVHTGVAWAGAYPIHDAGVGMGYTLKLGEDIKATWNNYRLSNDDFFYIPAQGHCSVFVNRKQFLDFGGYQSVHRVYGGEFYINSKWWMFGSTVCVEPRAIGFHLASSRGYSWNHDNYIENVLGNSYALSMDDWRERYYINCLRTGRKEVLDKMLERNEKEHGRDREFIEAKRVKTFNQVLTERPWSKLNQVKFGRSNDNMLIFEPTWLNLLQNSSLASKEAYKNSKHQKALQEFIKEYLWDYVYHKDEFDKNNLPQIT